VRDRTATSAQFGTVPTGSNASIRQEPLGPRIGDAFEEAEAFGLGIESVPEYVGPSRSTTTRSSLHRRNSRSASLGGLEQRLAPRRTKAHGELGTVLGSSQARLGENGCVQVPITPIMVSSAGLIEDRALRHHLVASCGRSGCRCRPAHRRLKRSRGPWRPAVTHKPPVNSKRGFGYVSASWMSGRAIVR
jgi:hypothetical protein